MNILNLLYIKLTIFCKRICYFAVVRYENVKKLIKLFWLLGSAVCGKTRRNKLLLLFIPMGAPMLCCVKML